jgi:hypothetical protein
MGKRLKSRGNGPTLGGLFNVGYGRICIVLVVGLALWRGRPFKVYFWTEMLRREDQSKYGGFYPNFCTLFTQKEALRLDVDRQSNLLVQAQDGKRR